MKWTKEKPTQHGWYWYREEICSPHCCCMIIDGGRGLYFGRWASSRTVPLKEVEGEFAGPIPEPTEE